jgi:hypothetical protein
MCAAQTSDPLGDFQTPEPLAAAVWQTLDLEDVDLLVEPTVGLGSFIATVPARARGVPWLAYDINAGYVEAAYEAATRAGVSATVEQRDAFSLDSAALRAQVAGRTVLAVGNPPWVTNAAQSAADRPNLPAKWNRFGLRGLDAKTGKANFDIAEAILLSMLAALDSAREVRLAVLVKRSVAVKMAKDALGRPGVVSAAFSRIDAKKWFNASVEAGLFQLTFRPATNETTSRLCLAENLGATSTRDAGLVGDLFIEDLGEYARVQAVEAREGQRLVWRQGLKHDAAKILELKHIDGDLVNGFGQVVDVEDDVLCPFYKSSDLASERGASRRFPLYQHDLGGPLRNLRHRWPRLAIYLEENAAGFAARGSSIYRGKPDFMLFGVGAYTLAPYKVAISGFYKEPRFNVLGPDRAGRPPLVDDTCYMLPFETRDQADAMAAYLNSEEVQRFLRSISDRTAKRPYTKDILGRIAVPHALHQLTESQGPVAALF